MELIVPLAERVRRIQALPAAARDPSEHGADVDVPQAVRDAADEALLRGETHYTDRPGILPLRRLVAAELGRRFALDVDAGSGVVITCGGTEARFVAVQQLLPQGGTLVALSRPERVAAACIVRGVTLAGPEEVGVEGSLALYLDGEAPADTTATWLQRAGERGWAIIFEAGSVDGGDRAASDTGHPAASGLAEQTVTIGSLGLGHGMAAWRLGFIAAPSAKAGPLRDFKQALTLCSTNVSQWGALGLEGGEA